VRWWLPYYAFGMIFMAWLTGLQPDEEKIALICKRAVRVVRV
jgi:hypothetical protein